MPQGATFRVEGYREFMRAIALADKEQRRKVRATFRAVGEDVRRDAQTSFSPIDARSAAGYRTVVRQRGIAVEQSKRKTTGQHPEYGSLQMRRALVPALESNEPELARKLERAMDEVADHFNRGP